MPVSEREKRLVGAWGLVSYVAEPVNGGDPWCPMGSDPQGLIVYTDSGRMSVNFQSAGRKPYAEADPHGGTDAERAEAASGFVGYSGTYRVTDEGIVEHNVTVSLLPNWIGTVVARRVDLRDDLLRLSLVEPLVKDGTKYDAVLTWQRV
jgi:hypothetical protein